MANPNGPNLTENFNPSTGLVTPYVWADDDVYELVQADTVEGAAVGASFNGIGVDNAPHQLLLNKAKFIKGRQDTNIANIGLLQAFQALFVGALTALAGGANSYIEIPYVDSARGASVAIVQWGMVDFGSGQPEGLYGPYAFPIPFLNAISGIWFSTLTDEKSGQAGTSDNVIMLSTASLPSKSQFSVWNNSVGGTNKARGFSWIAIGY